MSEDPNEFAKDTEAPPVLGFIKAGLCYFGSGVVLQHLATY
jgi:hypothetical protein